jgi:glycerol-1-phosphate dehydrogenase [NAD(P)+]
MLGSEILESIVPRSILIGNSILNKIPQIVKSLRFNPKIMIISGSTTQKIIGRELASIMEENDFNFDSLIVDEASLEAAEVYKNEVETRKSNIIIGAGGGKTIDIGKYCSWKSKNRVELISVPTTTPHDGIASPFIFLNNPTEKFIGESRSCYCS